MAPKPIQGCAFCTESANLTGEHLFADWIDRIFTASTSHYVFTDNDPITLKVRKYGSRRLNKKFKVVCATCNNGWMSKIDNAARNTLKDVIRYRAPICFLRSGLQAIAEFTLKNAFVADYVNARPFFGTYSRAQFRRHRQFPPGTHIWLGAIRTERHVKHGICRTLYGKPDIDTPLGIQTFIFTWSAECLLLQLAAARWTNVLYSADGYPQLSQEAQFNDAFVPFFPRAPLRVTWPPRRYVSHNNLDMVSNRFSSIRFS